MEERLVHQVMIVTVRDCQWTQKSKTKKISSDTFVEQFRKKKMIKLDMEIESLRLRNKLLRQELKRRGPGEDIVVLEENNICVYCCCYLKQFK